MPLFSIIVPVYKIEKYLYDCIESVLKQTVQCFELILVDDGSPDGCPEICDFYASKNKSIKVIHKKNGGLVSARQAGINISTGKYILNVDGDDYIASNLLETLECIVKRYEPDIVAYNFYKVLDDGKLIGEGRNNLPPGLYSEKELKDVYKKLLFDMEERNLVSNTGNMIYAIWGKAIKRELLVPLQNQVPLGIKNGEDVAVTIPAVCKCKTLYVLNEFLYYYRIRTESMVHSFRKGELQRLTTLICFLRNHADKLKDENIVGYGFRQIDGHIISAMQNMKRYKLFKIYIKEELNPILLQIIKEFDGSNLQMKYRIRVLALKKKLFWIFWLVYHKG